MIPIAYPEITRVEVIATQPIPADIRSIQYIQSNEQIRLNEVTYLVKLNLNHPPSVTSRALNLYVDDYQIARYSSFPGGIYFKIFNPKFLADYAGKKILFSTDGLMMHDSGQRLPDRAENLPEGAATLMETTSLPTQEQVLSQP